MYRVMIVNPNHPLPPEEIGETDVNVHLYGCEGMKGSSALSSSWRN